MTARAARLVRAHRARRVQPARPTEANAFDFVRVLTAREAWEGPVPSWAELHFFTGRGGVR